VHPWRYAACIGSARSQPRQVAAATSSPAVVGAACETSSPGRYSAATGFSRLGPVRFDGTPSRQASLRARGFPAVLGPDQPPYLPGKPCTWCSLWASEARTAATGTSSSGEIMRTVLTTADNEFASALVRFGATFLDIPGLLEFARHAHWARPMSVFDDSLSDRSSSW
jgi:hypothetical protein